MRYRLAYIAHLFARTFEKGSGKLVKEIEYFSVLSKSGRCGHKHRTEAAAQPCLERMKKEWSRRRRSRQMKEAWARRKAVQAATRVTLPRTSNLVSVW
jgi:hypothetical protein